MKFSIVVVLAVLVSGCTYIDNPSKLMLRQQPTAKVAVAYKYLNYGERTHRSELIKFTGVDPVRTQWCAAFVNAVLTDSGIPGSETVSDYPLTARSFLTWGDPVTMPQPGDIVVFPRGNQGWQGHVGFYLGTTIVNNTVYYQILGGNQRNKVSIELYRANRALGIRRAAIPTKIN